MYVEPGFRPAREILLYSPESGRFMEKLNKNFGLAVKSPSIMPTKRLVDCMSAGLPWRLTLKDKVGPYEVAMVGEEGAGVGVGDAKRLSSAEREAV